MHYVMRQLQCIIYWLHVPGNIHVQTMTKITSFLNEFKQVNDANKSQSLYTALYSLTLWGLFQGQVIGIHLSSVPLKGIKYAFSITWQPCYFAVSRNIYVLKTSLIQSLHMSYCLLFHNCLCECIAFYDLPKREDFHTFFS